MMETKAIHAVLHEELKRAGFRKKASSWYRQSGDLVQIFHLQRSQWGPRYYLNVACAPLGMAGEIEGMPMPKEHMCPVRTRLDRAYPEKEKEWEVLFDFERPMEETQRVGRLREVLTQWILPVMEEMKDVATVKAGIKGQWFLGSPVTSAGRRFFGV